MSKDIQSQHSKQTSFEVFRYQLVVDKAFQSDAFQHQYHNIDELKAAKNDIFKSIITENNFNFNSGKSDITSQLVHQKGDMYYFKVNVRRDKKIPKKDFTEAGYIEDVVTRIALIHPEIAIKLINTGKTIIQTPGNNDFKAVIYSIYGKDIAENILEIN